MGRVGSRASDFHEKDMIGEYNTLFPDLQSFSGQFTDLPPDIFPAVVEQLCGGAGVSDITLWKHACKLAQTCTCFRDAVLNTSILRNVEFRGELVGDAAPVGDDPMKESLLQVNRTRFMPEITLVIQYGVSAYEVCGPMGTVMSNTMLSWTRPLDLDTVLSTFAKPPGWKAAAKLTISGKEAPPWSGCFPVDKLPEPGRPIPTIHRFTGQNSVLRFEREETVLATKETNKTDTTWDSDAVAMSGCVVAMCSTGIETFKRGDRAHYLEDLEIGITTGVPQKVLDDISMRRCLLIDPREPPDLYYRFKPDEARRLAGYDVHNPQAVYEMLYPPPPPEDRKRRWVGLDHEEEWDPDLRTRQKAAAREKTRKAIEELNRSECYGISADDKIPVRFASNGANAESDSDSDSGSDSDSDPDSDPDSEQSDNMPSSSVLKKRSTVKVVVSDSEFDSDSDDDLPPPKSTSKQAIKTVTKPASVQMTSSQVHKAVFQESPSAATARTYGYPLNPAKYGLTQEWLSKLKIMWERMGCDSRYTDKETKTRVRYLQAIGECVRFLKRHPCVHAELGVVNGTGIYEVETLVVLHTAKWRAHCIPRMQNTGPGKTLDQWYSNILKLIDLCGPSKDSLDPDEDWAWANMAPERDGDVGGVSAGEAGASGMPRNEGLPSANGDPWDSDDSD